MGFLWVQVVQVSHDVQVYGSRLDFWLLCIAFKSRCLQIYDCVCSGPTEKAALLSPDDEVQKSDISSSSQGLVEKEALGPMLLEVSKAKTHVSFLITVTVVVFQISPHVSPSSRPSMGFSLLSTGRDASSSFLRM